MHCFRGDSVAGSVFRVLNYGPLYQMKLLIQRSGIRQQCSSARINIRVSIGGDCESRDCFSFMKIFSYESFWEEGADDRRARLRDPENTRSGSLPTWCSIITFYAGNHRGVRFAKPTSASITGTSTNTPTMVTKATGEDIVSLFLIIVNFYRLPGFGRC